VLFFYFDYFGVFRYFYGLAFILYWRFRDRLTSFTKYLFMCFFVSFLNKLAYFMFFDFHFNSINFIYLFLPRKPHLQDPAVYNFSYPAVIHPWIRFVLSLLKVDPFSFAKFNNSLYYFWNTLLLFLQLC